MKWFFGILTTAIAMWAVFYYSHYLSENDPQKAFMRRFHAEMAVLTTSADSVRVATHLIRVAQDSVATISKDSIQLMKNVVNTIWITNNSATSATNWTKEKILKTAEVQPEFPGGNEKALKDYLIKNINNLYFGRNTAETKGKIDESKAEKHVYNVDFVVNLDGSIQDIEVECEDEKLKEIVAKAIRDMPKWKPGKYKGFDVRSHYRFRTLLEM
jgi:hypothetical protein